MASEKASAFDYHLFFMSVMVGIISILLMYGVNFITENYSNSTSKPFNTFDEFYPFYNSQHQNNTCRILHFIGTSIFITFALFNVSVLYSISVSILIGYSFFTVTKFLNNGLLEFLICIITFFLFMRKLTGTFWKANIIFVAYLFAWIGHFFFEKNTPATFIYPIYSLFGDFKLWFEIGYSFFK
jgi:hypothetical protein